MRLFGCLLILSCVLFQGVLCAKELKILRELEKGDYCSSLGVFQKKSKGYSEKFLQDLMKDIESKYGREPDLDDHIPQALSIFESSELKAKTFKDLRKGAKELAPDSFEGRWTMFLGTPKQKIPSAILEPLIRAVIGVILCIIPNDNARALGAAFSANAIRDLKGNHHNTGISGGKSPRQYLQEMTLCRNASLYEHSLSMPKPLADSLNYPIPEEAQMKILNLIEFGTTEIDPVSVAQ